MDGKIFLAELINQNLITEESSKKLFQESALSKKNVDEIVYERRLADEDKISQIKSQIIGVPYKKIKLDEIDGLSDELLNILPEEMARNYKAIPLSKTNDILVVGMVNPDDIKAQEALKFIGRQLRLNLGVYLIAPSVWETVLRRYSPYSNEISLAISSLSLDPLKSSLSQIVKLEEGALSGEEAPIIKIVASTLKEAVYSKASDIHIEPQRGRLRIRFRIDGELQEVSSMPIAIHQLIVSRVKVLSNLKIDETRVPQDGRFRTILLGRDIDFRVATFPTPVGEKVAIRVLDPQVGLKGLEELGLSHRNFNVVNRAIEKPYGMILISGPTGSGKTTTLYATMQILNKEESNIVSLEDPVEYFIDGLNQSQVRPEIGYDFASGLRQILRQDPDVIMVGEIRDNETAGLAIHASLTGHIVLSTLHTNNAVGVIPRLIDMKVEPFLLPASINLMISQRLVSMLCQKCKKTEKPNAEVQSIIKKELEKIPKDIIDEQVKKNNLNNDYETYRAVGCSACKNKGIVGRIALFEILEMTPELEEIVNTNPREDKILEQAKKQGMVSLRQDGVLKALKGLVSIEEVMRETKEM